MYDKLSPEELRLWRDILQGDDKAYREAMRLAARSGYGDSVPRMPVLAALEKRALQTASAPDLRQVHGMLSELSLALSQRAAIAARLARALEFFVPMHWWVSTHTGKRLHAELVYGTRGTGRGPRRGTTVGLLCGSSRQVADALPASSRPDKKSVCSNCLFQYRILEKTVHLAYREELAECIVYGGDFSELLKLAA